MVYKVDGSSTTTVTLEDLLFSAYCIGKHWDEYQANGSVYEFEDWYKEIAPLVSLNSKEDLQKAFEAGTHMVVDTMNQAHAIDFEEYYENLQSNAS